MNSYTLTEKLRKARRKVTIKACSQALYYELIAICNEDSWSNGFLCKNADLQAALGISEKTLISARTELVDAGLVEFRSGKSVKLPCVYSLNNKLVDYLNDLPNGYLYDYPNGCKNYSQVDEKTPDNNKEETKRETKTETLVVEVDRAQARQKEIEEAINDCYKINTEKEKNSAQKEKDFPALDDAITKVAGTAAWRNIVEHHAIREDDRPKLFKVFYEQKEDTYRIRYPALSEMSSNFYFWVGTLKKLNKLNDILNPNEQQSTVTKHSPSNNRNTAKDKRNELLALINQSEDFLQRTSGQNDNSEY